MEETLKLGDLVYLTAAYEKFWKKRNPNKDIRFANRLAKLEDIIDWESDRGKLIKRARMVTGKWDKLPLEDNKWIFSIYYPDLPGKEGRQGVVQRGVPLFSKDPETGEPFFLKVPNWFYTEILKKCESFKVEVDEKRLGALEEFEKDKTGWDVGTNVAFIKKAAKRKP